MAELANESGKRNKKDIKETEKLTKDIGNVRQVLSESPAYLHLEEP